MTKIKLAYSEFKKDALEGKPYVKISGKRIHKGPLTEEKVNWIESRKVSNSARKLALTENLKVSITDRVKDKDEDEAYLKASSFSYVILTKDANNQSFLVNIPTAWYIIQAWADVYGDRETDDAAQKYTDFIKARNEAYQTLGINPASKAKPVLTKDQRQVYDSIVRPFAYDYWEVHVTFVNENGRTVLGQTYTMIRRPKVQLMLDKLSSKVNQLATKWKVRVVQDPNDQPGIYVNGDKSQPSKATAKNPTKDPNKK
jgi:hypothetical protein